MFTNHIFVKFYSFSVYYSLISVLKYKNSICWQKELVLAQLNADNYSTC